VKLQYKKSIMVGIKEHFSKAYSCKAAKLQASNILFALTKESDIQAADTIHRTEES